MPLDQAEQRAREPVPPRRGPRAESTAASAQGRARLPRGAERRRFRRVETPLDLRFVHDGAETAGRLLDVSPGGARIGSEDAPPKGTRIAIYAERIGRLEAEVVRVTEGGFAVRFTHRLGRAKRLADALTWVLNRPPERDRRRARRYPQDEPARLCRADGSVLACRILDISTTGASVRVPDQHRPPVGERIVLGVMRARVVRHHHDGIGVLFAEPGAGAPADADTASPNHTSD